MCWPPVQAWPTSNERSETGRAIPLFKAALQELPQMDSIYAGFENGAWLQVRRISDLTEEQREALARTCERRYRDQSDSPHRRAANCRCGESFRIRQGNEIDEIDLWKYGYDARKRSWYWADDASGPALCLRALSLVQHRRAGHHRQRAACAARCPACLPPISSSIPSAISSRPSGRDSMAPS